MRGKLFSEDFLREGIRHTAQWYALNDDAVERDRKRLSEIFSAFPASTTPNEAATERDIILPVLEVLGWTAILPQQATPGRRSVTDFLLFESEDVKKKASKEPSDDRRYEGEFGRFLTRDLILAYMNAVAAGDLETQVSI